MVRSSATKGKHTHRAFRAERWLPREPSPIIRFVVTTLLQTKLFIPQPRPSLVARPRLHAVLDAAVAGRLTLVSAPAGFGKTTLVAEWVQQRAPRPSDGEPVRVAWISLDANDNDPARFFSYVTAALQTLHAAIGRDLNQVLQSAPPEALVSLLLNDVTAALAAGDLSGRLVLVIDDYHLIDSQPIHTAVDYLLDHLPPQMHLVLLSRSDPPLSLSRLRVRRQMTEIRARDLRFTTAEAAQFLNSVMDLSLSAAEVATLERRTEGWIAGLQLAAHSLQLQENQANFLATFAGDDRYVADYLLEEVLYRQPARLQTFLLRTSILARFNASLCAALVATDAADAQTILEHLEQANLFLVPLDSKRHWYRYHQLFADLLCERLEESGEDVAALHRRAGAWYEAHDLPVAAVQHALAAADYENAVRLMLLSAPQTFGRSELTTVTGWWAQLPPAVRQAEPGLCMMFAWAWLATGRPDMAEICLQTVETAVGAAMDALFTRPEALDDTVRRALIEVAVMRARLAVDNFELAQTLAYSRQVLPALQGNEVMLFNRATDLRPVALFNAGLAHHLLGRLDEGEAVLREAAAAGEAQQNLHLYVLAVGHLAGVQSLRGQLHAAVATARHALARLEEMRGKLTPLAGLLYAELGTVYYEWNELDAAQSQWQRAVELAGPWGSWEALLPAYVGLALVQRARGERQEALQTLEALLALTPAAEATAPLAQAYRAWLLAEQGEQATSQRLSADLDVLTDGETPVLREAEAVVLARALLAQQRPQQALALVERLLPAAEAGRRWRRVVALLALHALAHEALGAPEAALRSLAQALTQAQPHGYVRTFIDGGPPLAPLLYRALEADLFPRYCGELLAVLAEALPTVTAAAPPVADVDESMLEPLSEREVEVLHLIAAGLTNREIAEQLFIAHGTVKVHAHNIYSKLDVDGRVQAVAKARALGLLTDA